MPCVLMQAPAAKKVVKKATKPGGGGKKKTKAVESYKIYIYKVLKQVRHIQVAVQAPTSLS